MIGKYSYLTQRDEKSTVLHLLISGIILNFMSSDHVNGNGKTY